MVALRDALLVEPLPIRNMSEIARRHGFSREYVRQVVRRLELPTRFPQCRRCSWCWRPIDSDNSTGFCQRCLSWTRRTVIQCRRCGAFKVMRTRAMRTDGRYRGNRYCSQLCANKVNIRRAIAGRTCGFTPEERRKRRNANSIRWYWAHIEEARRRHREWHRAKMAVAGDIIE